MHAENSEGHYPYDCKDDCALDDPYLTVEQAAKRLKVKRDTLDRWRMNGTGPVFRYHGGRVVYHVKELDHWSDDNRQTQARKIERKRKGATEIGGAS